MDKDKWFSILVSLSILEISNSVENHDFYLKNFQAK